MLGLTLILLPACMVRKNDNSQAPSLKVLLNPPKTWRLDGSMIDEISLCILRIQEVGACVFGVNVLARRGIAQSEKWASRCHLVLESYTKRANLLDNPRCFRVHVLPPYRGIGRVEKASYLLMHST